MPARCLRRTRRGRCRPSTRRIVHSVRPKFAFCHFLRGFNEERRLRDRNRHGLAMVRLEVPDGENRTASSLTPNTSFQIFPVRVFIVPQRNQPRESFPTDGDGASLFPHRFRASPAETVFPASRRKYRIRFGEKGVEAYRAGQNGGLFVVCVRCVFSRQSVRRLGRVRCRNLPTCHRD